jgi:hypothetical protein
VLLGGLAVLVLVSSPFAIRYATEARPYSLVMLLVTTGYVVFRRAIERPTLGRLALVAVIAGLLLYTHYWSIYLIVALFGFVVWRAWQDPDVAGRHAYRATAVALVVGSLTFLPWVPTFLYQSAHTATPWGDGQVPLSSFRQTFDQFANGASLTHATSNALELFTLLLIVLALFGRATGPRNIDLDVRTRPDVRWEALVAFVALTLGLMAGWITNGAYDARYASVVFPLLALITAYGFAVIGSRTLMLALVGVFVAVGLLGSVVNVFDNRTQAGELADVIRAEARPGDVVAYCPDQLGPSVSRLLEGSPDLQQLTFPAGKAPALVDWVDYHDRIDATSPAKFAQKVLDQAGPDHAVWYVFSPSYFGVEGKCEDVASALSSARPGARTRVVQQPEVFFENGNLLQLPRR